MLHISLIGLMLCMANIGVAQESFALQDLDGKQHHLADYKGKWLVVNYWATWCPPCLEEIPDLVNLYDQRGKTDVMVIGVVFDYENVNQVKHYMEDMLISYPIVLGNDKITRQIGSAAVLPTSYIYNPNGELVKIKRGAVTREYLEKLFSGKLK